MAKKLGSIKRFPRLKHMIINIRGASGSGKSYIIHRLLSHLGSTPLRDPEGKIWAYQLKTSRYPKTYVLGRYESLGGGCDAIRGTNTLENRILTLAETGNVLFEGRAASVVSGRWIEMAESTPQHKWVFLELTTSAGDCVRGVSKRRIKRGFLKTPKAKNIIRDRDAVSKAGISLFDAGLEVRGFSSEEALAHIYKLLRIK